jgi:hypothetical protein
MPAFEEYKRIEPISGSEPKKVQLQPSEAFDEGGPSKVKFDEAVSRADSSRVELRDIAAVQETVVAEVKKPSLMEVATKVTGETEKVAPTPKQLADQAADLRRQMDRPRAVLIDIMDNYPSPAVPVVPNPADVSVVNSLSGSLEHMDRGLRDVSQLSRGVEVGSVAPAEKTPAVRFLSFLTESDKKLGNFVEELKGIQSSQQKLTPGDLMAVQVKLGFIQTELEFFTATLNKALESTKTLMNVQI